MKGIWRAWQDMDAATPRQRRVIAGLLLFGLLAASVRWA
jgi:hypothetical protein